MHNEQTVVLQVCGDLLVEHLEFLRREMLNDIRRENEVVFAGQRNRTDVGADEFNPVSTIAVAHTLLRELDCI